MPQVQDIKVLNIDDVQYAVESMSETCQRLVVVYNEWNQKEANARDEVTVLQAAKETLSRQIIDQVRKEKAEEAAAEAASEGTTKEQSADAVKTTEAPPAEEAAQEAPPAEEAAQEAPGDE